VHEQVGALASRTRLSDLFVSPEKTIDRSGQSKRNARAGTTGGWSTSAVVTLTRSSCMTTPPWVSSCACTSGTSGGRPSSAMRVSMSYAFISK